jgi:hypothetical protein
MRDAKTVELDPDLEEKIRNAVVEELAKGRPNWDVPHTLDSVEWMKKLVGAEGGDEKVLVTAMYFHDTGYPILESGYSHDDAMQAKKSHAQRGSEFAQKSLREVGQFSDQEIQRICYLVENHDRHDDIETLERQLVFEADGLAQINVDKCPPSFGKEEFKKFLTQYFQTERPRERWKTTTGRMYYEELLPKAIKYYQDN